MLKQCIEQVHVGARADGQVQVGRLRRRGLARVDHNNTRAPLALRFQQALVKHRMAPCEITADHDHEIGELQVFIASRHRV